MTGSTSPKLFWDSCVLLRYLTEEPSECVSDINQMIAEAKGGKRQIWISTILYAEVRPSQLRKKGYESVMDLVKAFEGNLLPIGPTPPILLRAARLRDHKYHPAKPQKDEKMRVLGVPDSIHLATCLYVKEELGAPEIEFHTFDDGRGKNYEERAVSLLRYHEYSTHITHPDVSAVCNLPRVKPIHASPSML